MGIAELIRAIAELLLSGEGTWVLGVAAVSLIAAPLVQRWFAGRKQVYYRVQSDSKIGLDVNLHDADDGDGHADEELIAVAKVVNSLSFVVIRIRNTGGDVALSDLGDEAVEFTFRGRVIWNARISDATDPKHREDLVNSLEFFSTDTAEEGTPPPEAPVPLPKVRKEMLSRWRELLRSSAPVGTAASAPPLTSSAPPAPVWHGIRLRRTLSLAAKEKFKIVVVLREPQTNNGHERTKGVDGPKGHRRIRDERTVRRARWPVVTGGIGVLLAGALVTANLVPDSVVTADPSIECVGGDLDIVGSSAFTPIMTMVAEKYDNACGDATVRVTATGSIAGVRELAGVEPARRNEVAAMSDGKVSEATRDLVPQPVAVVVYTLVVNDSVGISGLTIEQVRGIYAGRYRDWAQLRPGPSLPIRVVGRGQESGSRRTFERTVLAGTSEGNLTSDSCESTDRTPGAPVIRCERDTESQQIDEVISTPGAIGYMDVPLVSEGLTVLALDSERPSVSGISAGYPFWTIEYLYTKGVPAAGTLLAAFIDHLRGPDAGETMTSAGHIPCTGRDGQLHLLCHD